MHCCERGTARTGQYMISGAVMTGFTVVGNTLMTEYGWYKRIHRVADITILHCRQMTRAFNLSYRRQELVNMTAFATRSQVVVHSADENGGHKAVG